MSAEKERLQALFAPFNDAGSFMTMAEGEEEPLMLDLVDSFIVTRADGESFWLFHKFVGYNNSGQGGHTIKVVSWSQDDTYLIDMVDDRGRRFHVEEIMPETEPDLVEAWRRWRAYRKRHQEGFALVDADLLNQHVNIALRWDAPASEEDQSSASFPGEEDGAKPAGPVRLRYMVEGKLRMEGGEFHYDPIGVWVEGPGEGLDIVIRFLPEYEEEQADADAAMERMRAAGMLGIPDGFLEYHQEQMSPYRGDRGAIITTHAFSSANECAQAVLQRIKAEHV